MSVAAYISSIESSRNVIRNKLIELGMAVSTDKLDKLAIAIEGLVNQGAVSVTVQEGDTYTIPAGYHNGNGTVSGVKGGGNYTLQAKTATPTKKQQTIAPDSGFYGLSGVTVAPIPQAYQDVSSVNTTAADVLTGKIFVTADGVVTPGEMVNNGAVNKTLDATTITYTIPKGYHSGSGKVQIVLETKNITPTKSTQKVTPTSGKVLSEVTVNPIPDEYVTTTDATATADQILDDEIAYVDGVKIIGTMPNNGSVVKTLDTAVTSVVISKGYHNGTGKVSIATETKTVTPTKSTQHVTPTSGKVLAKVSVEAIPNKYQDVSDVDAVATDVLAGKTIVNAAGEKVSGAMVNNGSVSESMDGMSTTSITVPAGYTSGGVISLTKDIENALAAI